MRKSRAPLASQRPVRPSPQMYYGGFDLSLTATGIVILDSKGEVVERAVIKLKTKGAERLHDICKAVEKLISPYRLKMVCIEGYSMASVGQLAQLGELGGCIRMLLHQKEATPYYTPTPNQLKKFATGLGVGEKDIVMMHVYKNWGFQAVDNNEGDAYTLARIALGICNLDPKLSKEQKEVVQTILNPPVKKKKKKKEDV